MYEAEVKQVATWLNSKFDLLGDRIPEHVEQMALEWIITALVTFTPETFRGLPLRSMLVGFVIQWIKDPEVNTAKVADFLSSVQPAQENPIT